MTHQPVAYFKPGEKVYLKGLMLPGHILDVRIVYYRRYTERKRKELIDKKIARKLSSGEEADISEFLKPKPKKFAFYKVNLIDRKTYWFGMDQLLAPGDQEILFMQAVRLRMSVWHCRFALLFKRTPKLPEEAYIAADEEEFGNLIEYARGKLYLFAHWEFNTPPDAPIRIEATLQNDEDPDHRLVCQRILPRIHRWGIDNRKEAIVEQKSKPNRVNPHTSVERKPGGQKASELRPMAVEGEVQISKAQRFDKLSELKNIRHFFT